MTPDATRVHPNHHAANISGDYSRATPIWMQNISELNSSSWLVFKCRLSCKCCGTTQGNWILRKPLSRIDEQTMIARPPTRFSLPACVAVFVLCVASGFSFANETSFLVVCPPKLRPSMAAWELHRISQGLKIGWVDSAPTASEVLAKLNQSGRGQQTPFILLVGDCRIAAANQADPSCEVPTHYRSPGPTAAFGTTPSLPGDAPYGDLDGDGVPEIAVGRIPTTDPAALENLCQRIIAYETSNDFGPWRDTVQITAGVGGFGLLADAAIESATRAILTSALPPQVQLRVTYASPNSPFNPGPDDFFPTVLNRYREGGLFWVYLGHGQVTELDHVPGPGGSVRAVLCKDDVHLLERPANGAPIALMFACYTGAFDANTDSLAEKMLFAPGGPIAVLAGSRVTMPYGNAIAAQGLIDACYSSQANHLGLTWLNAQRELAATAESHPAIADKRRMLDMVATTISPNAAQLPEERLEHIHLYNLLGDPSLQLKHPKAIDLQVPRGVAPGTELLVKGNAPNAGVLRLFICYPPGGATADQQLSPVERYARANCVELTSSQLSIDTPGLFETTITIPPHASGLVRVVARMECQDGWCNGAAAVLVRPGS